MDTSSRPSSARRHHFATLTLFVLLVTIGAACQQAESASSPSTTAAETPGSRDASTEAAEEDSAPVDDRMLLHRDGIAELGFGMNFDEAAAAITKKLGEPTVLSTEYTGPCGSWLFCGRLMSWDGFVIAGDAESFWHWEIATDAPFDDVFVLTDVRSIRAASDLENWDVESEPYASMPLQVWGVAFGESGLYGATSSPLPLGYAPGDPSLAFPEDAEIDSVWSAAAPAEASPSTASP